MPPDFLILSPPALKFPVCETDKKSMGIYFPGLRPACRALLWGLGVQPLSCAQTTDLTVPTSTFLSAKSPCLLLGRRHCLCWESLGRPSLSGVV